MGADDSGGHDPVDILRCSYHILNTVLLVKIGVSVCVLTPHLRRLDEWNTYGCNWMEYVARKTKLVGCSPLFEYEFLSVDENVKLLNG